MPAPSSFVPYLIAPDSVAEELQAQKALKLFSLIATSRRVTHPYIYVTGEAMASPSPDDFPRFHGHLAPCDATCVAHATLSRMRPYALCQETIPFKLAVTLLRSKSSSKVQDSLARFNFRAVVRMQMCWRASRMNSAAYCFPAAPAKAMDIDSFHSLIDIFHALRGNDSRAAARAVFTQPS